MLALIVLSSFVAALIGLFIGRFSEGLMIGVSGPLAVLCTLVMRCEDSSGFSNSVQGWLADNLIETLIYTQSICG
jgi:hypothetical protein